MNRPSAQVRKFPFAALLAVCRIVTSVTSVQVDHDILARLGRLVRSVVAACGKRKGLTLGLLPHLPGSGAIIADCLEVVRLNVLTTSMREDLKNPSHGNFPPPGPPRTRFSQKVSGNFLTKRGSTPSPLLLRQQTVRCQNKKFFRRKRRFCQKNGFNRFLFM